jgi:hypothetical protein
LHSRLVASFISDACGTVQDTQASDDDISISGSVLCIDFIFHVLPASVHLLCCEYISGHYGIRPAVLGSRWNLSPSVIEGLSIMNGKEQTMDSYN